jgi:hypothetical protein
MKLSLSLYNLIHFSSHEGERWVDVYPFFAHRVPTVQQVCDYLELEPKSGDTFRLEHQQEVDVLPLES